MIVDIKTEGADEWKKIHSKALEAINVEKKKQYDQYIIELQENFKCLDCRQHFGDYLEQYPPWKEPIKYDEMGRDITYFYWSWKFHHRVNKRLGKQGLTFQETYDIYKQNICTLTDSDKLVNVMRLIHDYQRGKIIPRRF